MNKPSGQFLGLSYALTGVLILSPDTLLIRLVDADSLTLMFWRGLLMGSTLMIGLLVLYRQNFLKTLLAIGPAGLLVILCFGGNSISFVTAITHTAVANTLLILSSAPLITALLSYLFLGEKIERRTGLAIFACMVGMTFIVYDGLETATLWGELAALCSTTLLSASIVIIRFRHDVNMVPCVAVSGLLVALLVWPITSDVSLRVDDYLVMATQGLLVLPLSFALLMLAPRYVQAAEVSLIMLLEAVFGPLLVWWYLAETPSTETLIGGGIVLGTLALHNIFSFENQSKTPQ